MRRLINIKNGVVTLLSAAVIAGLAACEADPVETMRGNLPDDELLENTNVLIRSQYSSVERAVVFRSLHGEHSVILLGLIFDKDPAILLVCSYKAVTGLFFGKLLREYGEIDRHYLLVARDLPKIASCCLVLFLVGLALLIAGAEERECG